MANWSDLKAAVASIVKTNGNKGITGQLLQNVLNNIISNVGLNSSFAGIATPETNPGTPDGNVFYLATTAGTYSNFNGIVIEAGEAVILEWKGSWVKKDSGFATKENVNQKLSEFYSEAVEYTNKQLDFIDREFDNETNKETEGDIVITDDDGNDVVKVSPKGVVVKDVSVSGNAFSLKQMLDYYDIDVEQNEEQDIVITDEKNEEVARFAPDGVYVKNLLIKKSNITLKQLIEFLSGDVEQSTEGDVIITDDEGNEVVRITPKGIIAKNIFKKSYFGAAQINPLGVGDSDKTIFNYDFYSLKSEDFEDNSVWNIVGNVLQSEYPGVAYKLKNKKTISIGEKTTYCRFIASEGTSFAVGFIAEGGYSYDSSLFSVSENSVNIHEAWVSTDELPNIRKSLPYNFISGKEYELIIRKDRHDNYLSVRDCQNGEVSNEIRTNQTAVLGDLYNEFSGGRQQGKICLVHISGSTPKIKNIRCVSKIVKPLLAIYGDSISEGDRVYNGQTYGDLLKEYLGTERVVISAISGTQVSNVIKRMTVELPILKPKFVMVSIGTNGGNTQEYFNQCKSIIESNGAIPIINVPPLGFSGLDAVRGYVSNLNCLSVRFDIATAKNNEISDGQYGSLFADGLHPNKEGHLAMFKRVFIDVIELLNY